MERYVCVHGHFYQPPRENPWLERVELQDSAYPFHDWNERITAECYAPNSVARILGSEGRIARLVNNYSRMSFNFGPTLLAWMAEHAPDVYQRILEADRDSQERFSGHGSALAQVFNHIIMPLADRADKTTQVVWGIRDFRHRFNREPEGMWLAETAVDLETLETLAEHGIRFTVLAPHQAARVRPFGSLDWQDVTGSKIDPSVAYVQKLPSGRSINLFFYDGPVSRAVAFEKLLGQGEVFADRVLLAFSDDRQAPQLVHLATDGESYGHHHAHGDMALAYAIEQIESKPGVKLTNYAEFLDRHPPQCEVEILENTSWSCAHGIERWRSHCGCNSGRPDWQQSWRGPLRDALDLLRDAVRPRFERVGSTLFRDPYAARNDYVAVLLDRRPETQDRFLERHAHTTLTPCEKVKALKLLEMQRNALLMYTSCGWFFDEISGIETVQLLMYAGRVLQLAEEVFGVENPLPASGRGRGWRSSLEAAFLDKLAGAASNLPELFPSGKEVFDKYVRPTQVGWKNMAAHYAVASLFEPAGESSAGFGYQITRRDGQTHEAGRVRLVVGHGNLVSNLTRESADFAYAAVHLGDHNVNAGVSAFPGADSYRLIADELADAFSRVDVPQILRLIDKHFGESPCSIASLFRDLQRQVLKRLLQAGMSEAMAMYHNVYERSLPLMRFLQHLSAPIPVPMQAATEVLSNTDLGWAFDDDDPNFDQIRALVRDARTWGVRLDANGLGYKFTRMLDRAAFRFRDNPAPLEPLALLAHGVELARELPFQANLWAPQNVFFDLACRVFPAKLESAHAGDHAAQRWVETFLGLGENLSIEVDNLRKKRAEMEATPTVDASIRELIAQRYVPLSTYRLQFTKDFPFAKAAELAPYLAELGISDLYASPILQARPGSAHGYDICDHSRLNDELGGDASFDALDRANREHGLGMVLDIVPNHMAINHPLNLWWMDVLEHGPSSHFAGYFDIDWHPVNPDLKSKVLLPVLGEQYGRTLESGRIRLEYHAGSFALIYYRFLFPVAPKTYGDILSSRLDWLTKRLGENHDHVLEYRSIITALGHLPPSTTMMPERQAERYREVAIVKRRLGSLTSASGDVQAAIDGAVELFNGKLDEPDSFNSLDQLISQQSYRLAFWRVATDEINYRRFFDINYLAAIRVENAEVFAATHAVAIRMLADGRARGLRVDHPDGLYTPVQYFRDLQEAYCDAVIRARSGAQDVPANLRQEIGAALAAASAAGQPGPLYVVAEKILGDNEALPRDWAVDGTSGYDFLNLVNGLFVETENAAEFDRIYAAFIEKPIAFGPLVHACKQAIMKTSMASEVSTLSHQIDRIAERNRRYRDYTLSNLRFALREFIACLSAYRTYTMPSAHVSDRDRQIVEAAIAEAKRLDARNADDVFDFIRDTVLLRNLDQFPSKEHAVIIDWAMRIQQVTGPVMAKGIEDTAFFIFNRLISLNEVGGQPDRFGTPIEVFHRQNAKRAADWPHSMLATSTHDTKRSEDVRARINVLSELPPDWTSNVNHWNDLLKGSVKQGEGESDGAPAPSANDRYHFFQTLVGCWPDPQPDEEGLAELRGRLVAYMQKAVKEAKQHSSWINPNELYDCAVRDYVSKALVGPIKDNEFLQAFVPFARRVAHFGRLNSLSQLVLKLTSPGVPDIYQGNELWDFSLVDPDNRRPVDFLLRDTLREEITPLLDVGVAEHDIPVKEMMANALDGRIKLYVTAKILRFRQLHRKLFMHGGYDPLLPAGAYGDAVAAFSRSYQEDSIVVAACVRPATVAGGDSTIPAAWADTVLIIPGGRPGDAWRNVLTGEQLQLIESGERAGLWMKDVLGVLPATVLEPANGAK
jgi:(1->4)-alpha-D-glucan 1-alpha-D-glucosylmutase